jgi:hypothetical protein
MHGRKVKWMPLSCDSGIFAQNGKCKLAFVALLDGCCGAAAPLAPSLRELAKIFDF